MPAHDFYKKDDVDVPEEVMHNGEVVFRLCKVCGCAEALLTPNCAGREVSVDEMELIYSGKLTF